MAASARIRKDVIAAVLEGEITKAEAARRCGVSRQSIDQYFSYHNARLTAAAERQQTIERLQTDPDFRAKFPASIVEWVLKNGKSG